MVNCCWRPTMARTPARGGIALPRARRVCRCGTSIRQLEMRRRCGRTLFGELRKYLRRHRIQLVLAGINRSRSSPSCWIHRVRPFADAPRDLRTVTDAERI